MIASATPLDFIMEFNKRRTAAVLPFLLFHIAQVETTSPDQAVRPSISTSHSPFSSLYCTLSHSLHLSSQSSHLSDSSLLLLIVFQSPCLHPDPSLHPLHPLCNLHISLSSSFFFFFFPIFTFLPLRWLHSATSCLSYCRENIKWCTLANPAEQHDSRLHRAHRAAAAQGATKADNGERTCSLFALHIQFPSCEATHTHIAHKVCKQQHSQVICAPMRPTLVLDAVPLQFGGSGRSEG